METIEIVACDEGAMGIRLDAETRPQNCPGLGGWKQDDQGVWWTRVKGDACRPFILPMAAGFRLFTVVMHCDRIIDVSIA